MENQNPKSAKKIVVVCGPTAVGKTDLGIELCRRFGGEIVSADSQQVYCGMDIGTAKDDLTGSGIPCHVVDVVDPDQSFDASQFQNLADGAIEEITSSSHAPFVIGGTGFYIKVLLNGLCEAPARSDEIRNELMELKRGKGPESLYEILRAEDPSMAERLNPRDFQRVIRAIEVNRLTGRSLTEFQRGHQVGHRYEALKIGLKTDRTLLYERINRRVDRMIERGLVDEVEGLVSKYGSNLQSLKAVGYKEIVSYLKGDTDLGEAIRLTKQNTRRFAKRQLTWFRNDPDIRWHKLSEVEPITKVVDKFIHKS